MSNARTEPIYFKVPSSLKQDFDTLCQQSGYTKTIFLTNLIHEKVEDYRRHNPNALPRSSAKKKTTDDRKGRGWLHDLVSSPIRY